MSVAREEAPVSIALVTELTTVGMLEATEVKSLMIPPSTEVGDEV